MHSAREILSKSGPEDSLTAVAQPSTSGLVTAGPDWVALRAPRPPSAPALDYPDEGDFARLRRLAAAYDGAAGVVGAGAGAVIRDLDVARNLCAKPRFNFELCIRDRKAHQAKNCLPVMLEVEKCRIKLTRAVDTLCRPQFAAFQKCRDGAGAGHATACVRERTAFDVCTEDF